MERTSLLLQQVKAERGASLVAQCQCRRHGFDSLIQEDPLEQEMATPSSILAWRIPRTEEPDELQSMGLQRVGYSSATEHAHIAERG